MSNENENNLPAEKQQDKKELISVDARENGQLVPRSLDAQWRLATAFHTSGVFPSQFDKPEKVLALMQFCYELNLPVMITSRQLMIINRTISMWGDLPLALVRRSGLIESFKETIFDADGNEIGMKNLKEPFGAKCYSKRKGGEEMDAIFTMTQATQAGLAGSATYKKYPADMLRYRARARVLKVLYPDVIGGIAIAEYDYGINPNMMTEDELRKESSMIDAERKRMPHRPISEIKEEAEKAAGGLFPEKEDA